MSDDNRAEISRPVRALIAFCVFLTFILTGVIAATLAYWLPLWLKPLALVPVMLIARYGAGKTWIESGCLVGMFGGLIALFTGVVRLIRMVFQS